MRTVIALASLLLAINAHAADPTPQPTAPTPNAAQSTDPRGAKSEQRPADTAAKSPAPAVAAPAANANRQPPTSAGRKPTDRLELDTTVVTGNRELPKVLYIVPWKKADIGDLPAQPFNTLLDEALTPVDRDVFRREVTYYGVVSAGANTPTAPATGPEK